METTNFPTIIANIRDEMSDLAPFGEELTDDELAMVAGAMRRLVYVGKTFHQGDLHNDYRLEHDDED